MDTSSVQFAGDIAGWFMVALVCVMVLPGIAFLGGFIRGLVESLITLHRVHRLLRARRCGA